MKGWTALAAYIGTIFAANWALQTFGFVPVGFGLMAPAGVFFAGLAFVLRDVVQDDLGKVWTVVAIIVGALCSWFISPAFALASGVAFLFSEGADFAVYTPLRKRSWIKAAVLSNTVGDVVDSVIFLWLAFGSLNNIAGLILGKWYVTAPLIVWWGIKHARRTRVAVA